MKHILPKPLPEPLAGTPAPGPPPQSAPPTTIAVTSAGSPALSPMQYGIPAGSSLSKNDMRNSAIDRRKRKYKIYLLHKSTVITKKNPARQVFWWMYTFFVAGKKVNIIYHLKKRWQMNA